MRQLTVIFFALIILAASAKDFTAYFVFKLNQNYIAQNLCINKDKPASTCHGKCFFNKKIKDGKQQENKYPFSKMENKQFNLYAGIISCFNFFTKKGNNTPALFYVKIYSSLYISELFHPPRLV